MRFSGIKDRFYFSLFLISFTSLLTEILLTRIFSVTLQYEYTFVVISLVMFGLSFGGAVLFIFRENVRKTEPEKFIFLILFLMSLSLFLFLFVPKYSYHIDFEVHAGITLLLIFVCQLPFFFVGLLMSYLYTTYQKESGRIYFFDLVGAGCGSLFSVGVINYFGAIASLILLGITTSIALLFVSNRRTIWVALILVAVFASLLPSQDLFNITVAKGRVLNNIFTKWNSFSMVSVYGDENSSLPSNFSWCESSAYNGSYPAQLGMDIDAGAFTPIVKYAGNLSKVEFLKYDVTSFAYHLMNSPPASAFIAGPGGGRDILTALAFKTNKITAVEVNPIIVDDVMRGRFKNYSGGLYYGDNIDVVVNDARNQMQTTSGTYDVIQLSLVDTFAATSAGSYSLSENNLYTLEAVSLYLNHLPENGYLTISHWYLPQSLKLTATYLSAAEKLGIKDPREHIALIRCGNVVNHIIKKSAFTPGELEKLRATASSMNFDVIYPSNNNSYPTYSRLVESTNLADYIANETDDINPATDDSPFFFNTKKIVTVPTVMAGTVPDSGIFLLYGLLRIGVLLTFVLIILPTYLSMKNSATEPPGRTKFYAAYFSLLGLSFMLIEISFIQKFRIFLGYPIYTIAVIISSLLVFAGIGSFLTRNLPVQKIKSGIKIAILVTLAITTVYGISLHALFTALAGLNIEIKILVSILLLGLLGVFMGMPFPLGMKLIESSNAGVIPLCWSLNGAFSVLGSILAVILSMNIGFTYTILIAAGLYLIAYLISRSKKF
jgi:hypothetical protein